MANVLYEKTPTMPSAQDSLRRALFLTVWLRRQEMKVKETLVLANGIVDMVEGKGSTRVAKAFSEFVDAAYPFAVGQRSDEIEKMREVMQKEVSKGAISFTPIDEKAPFLKAARKRAQAAQEARPDLRGRRKI